MDSQNEQQNSNNQPSYIAPDGSSFYTSVNGGVFPPEQYPTEAYQQQGFVAAPLQQSTTQSVSLNQPQQQPYYQSVSNPPYQPAPQQVFQPTPQQDYSHFDKPARIAIYDDLRSAPRIIQIQGGPTHELIERIASLTYQHAKELGGMLPYTVIREVSENFIHANFNEVVVSILDKGNTIRFSDQGPGIRNKDLVQQPGFTSATEPMKRYIRGVGSGFPLMNDYLEASKGYYTIEDNVDGGAVITISLVPHKHRANTDSANQEDIPLPTLTDNETAILKALLPRQTLGVTELHNKTNIAVSSIHASLSKMEAAGLVEKTNKKRVLTDIGYELALSL